VSGALPDTKDTGIEVVDLGRMAYARAYDEQLRHHAEVLESRAQGGGLVGRLLLVEHDPPVITVSRRPEAAGHLLATPEMLARHGIEVQATDRGGDITYHGPGQQVVYPILDLNRLGLNLHAYIRLLEQAVIDVCDQLDLHAGRDACATGVWVRRDDASSSGCGSAGSAKVCAIGVRVRRWVSMHGLALNVSTNLEHFGLIVPCGLAGRAVTSLQREMGERCPTMARVRTMLASALRVRIASARATTGSDRILAP